MTIHEQVRALKNTISDLEQDLVSNKSELYRLERLPEYNKFANITIAGASIYDKLENEAHTDCRGSYNCGNPQYTQQFYVDDVLYVGILDVEYNRHDKQYYYIENTDFKVEKVTI
jgi:hypothetical protein